MNTLFVHTFVEIHWRIVKLAFFPALRFLDFCGGETPPRLLSQRVLPLNEILPHPHEAVFHLSNPNFKGHTDF